LLAWRSARAVLIVPFVEEVFWRAWLMRWLIRSDFRTVPIGTFQASSFCTVAVLFALEHGAYWDVGLVAGVLYNWWMVRTKSLADCVLAHAVTNACLSAYVITQGQWQYWQ
jgi:CAAX prenyl protease-like protein